MLGSSIFLARCGEYIAVGSVFQVRHEQDSTLFHVKIQPESCRRSSSNIPHRCLFGGPFSRGWLLSSGVTGHFFAANEAMGRRWSRKTVCHCTTVISSIPAESAWQRATQLAAGAAAQLDAIRNAAAACVGHGNPVLVSHSESDLQWLQVFYVNLLEGIFLFFMYFWCSSCERRGMGSSNFHPCLRVKHLPFSAGQVALGTT